MDQGGHQLGARGAQRVAQRDGAAVDVDLLGIGAEMLQPHGDAALPVEEAIAYGKKNGIPFASGQDILEAMENGGKE